MRVAIVAESFLPNVNGVVNSVLRVLEHLRRHGHEALVIAPGARYRQEEIFQYAGYRIARVPTVEIPGINSLPIGVPLPRVLMELKQFNPDVVHLASPFVLGGAGALAARALGLPCVAVYQTDVAGFANNYKAKALSTMAWQWTRGLHNSCTLTLAPSSVTIDELEEHNVRNIYHWGRGVDAARFQPSKRDLALRRQWLFAGERQRVRAGLGENPVAQHKRVIVGFVGRLAAEKSVERMAALNGMDNVQIVIIGGGPEHCQLQKLMPTAVFTGELHGEELARGYASLDVFVHTGEFETFCQAIQEAQASGLPTIAPAAGGPIDLIQPGSNGHLLSVRGFTAELPLAVERIIEEGIESYRANALAGIKGKTWPDLCEQLVGYYERAVYQHAAGLGANAKPVNRRAAFASAQAGGRRGGSRRPEEKTVVPTAAPAASATAENPHSQRRPHIEVGAQQQQAAAELAS
ncbi:glycosyltransferase family 4 protein [Corynebacterium heidelbergense]|uniref:Glycosyltransferase family 1 protein n=1 Tax=Corynebacterium heidelbergense TaxID=2055947 RepID=A0A364VDK5_9CORY|nr:glycosyltransferase family 1 protein [Corynebacterium heidelbergense]RAV34698.1 glycosyltransferase family 1 protein [Corynebacterium heidelbergense]WCZ37367.1 GDP-mannose-dependent alpha-mannosyltransferase [Corynebacterium heidelbergense]